MLALVAVALAADPRPLLVERFDAAEPPGWTVTDGAQVGSGPRSVGKVEEGALALRVAPTDQRFVAWTRSVPVDGATWIRVSARTRTEGVDPSAARFDNCNLFVRFPGGRVQAPKVFTGTNPWTPIEAVYPVPDGATSVEIGLFLSMPGAAWFDDVVVEAYDPGFQAAAHGRYVYHWLPGDEISPAHRAQNDRNVSDVAALLGVPDEGTFHYWKLPDNATKGRLTGDAGNAHTDGTTNIWSIWPVDRHEIVHVLSRSWGPAGSALLGEGLAVWASGTWQGANVRAYAKKLVAEKTWIPLDRIVESGAFRKAPDLQTYAIGGALVEWVIETRGRDVLRRAFPLVKDAASFEQALGLSPAKADEALRAWLAEG